MKTNETKVTALGWDVNSSANMEPQTEVDLECAPNDAAMTKGRTEPRDEQLNAAISNYQSNLPDWKLADLSLSDLASRLHQWADDLWNELIPKEWKGRAVTKPNFLFQFEWESPRILGHYHPGRNAAGCRWEISLNPANFTRLTEIQVASVVLHELLHCCEDLAGSAPSSHNGYHSVWLRKVASELGIPCTRFGCTCGIRPDSPFSDWSRYHGLQGTPILQIVPESPELTKQKRRPWICACPPGKAVTVHVAAGSNLRARCEVCGVLFHQKSVRAIQPSPTDTLKLSASSQSQTSCA